MDYNRVTSHALSQVCAIRITNQQTRDCAMPVRAYNGPLDRGTRSVFIVTSNVDLILIYHERHLINALNAID